MRILILGSGGREHALAWACASDERVSLVLIAPGNAGTAREPRCRNVDLNILDPLAVTNFAKDHADLTIIGPEAPLVAGVVDAMRAAGLRVFGPTQAAAQLEGSKAFAKAFMERHGIPTAHYAVFADLTQALHYLESHPAPIVIKADGLAAGKGVIVATSDEQARSAVTDMLSGHAFGQAGARVVIEEFLVGEEASFIVMVDGENVLPMATSQDHKRIGEGDTGPNTGGMGAYSPAPVVTPEVHAHIMRDIILPTVHAMAKDGHPYTGFLYAGLMIDGQGQAKVIEYNCRFGDPETQPILLRLESSLPQLIEAALDRRLHEVEARWNPYPALGIVMAAPNYPDTPRTGDPITGLDKDDPASVKTFMAGVRSEAGQLLTAGGRVLCVTALGPTVLQAQQRALLRAREIGGAALQYRQDIGYRAIARETLCVVKNAHDITN